MPINQESVLNNYAKAVEVGAYERYSPGRFGKQDHVRRYWEDRYTRRVLSSFMHRLVEYKRINNQGIRVMDLGCGAGEGLNILTTLPQTLPTLDAQTKNLLEYSDINFYKGVDISPAMIAKAKAFHNNHSQTEFVVADLNEGLPINPEEVPYDIYFSSYGSLSHLDNNAFKNLLKNICQHTDGNTIFVADLLGRYSYEWPCYWGDLDATPTGMRNYSMSYIYPLDIRPSVDVEIFPIRYWSAQELDKVVCDSVENFGIKIKERILCDRSILVGRHMDTQEYNSQAPSLRAAINSLYEPNTRTDLNELIFQYKPHPDHPYLNSFFQNLQNSWNIIVGETIEALNKKKDIQKLQMDTPIHRQPYVQNCIRIIRNLVIQAQNLHFDDPRANLIEPQLAYLLRDLEWNLQQGLGASHSLFAVYEFQKK
ncbi:MAG: class I SAM-dependent methyltransferase [Cyanobacteria bacterium P01_A01_bin.84]